MSFYSAKKQRLQRFVTKKGTLQNLDNGHFKIIINNVDTTNTGIIMILHGSLNMDINITNCDMASFFDP